LRLASAKSVAPYRVEKDGTVEAPGPDGKPILGRVAFLVGGRHREDALVRLADGRVQVFPLSHDVDRDASFEPLAELAGGTAPPPDVIDFWTRVGRNADLACYGWRQAAGRRGRRVAGGPSASRWIEPGVGCERAMGPAGRTSMRHVQPCSGAPLKMGAAGPAIVDGCAACHGLRDVLASPFSDLPAQRYGAPLYDAAEPLLTVASNFEFHQPFFDDLRPATYQQEAIAFLTGCARKGGLTCDACHDPHSGAPSPALSANDGGDGLCASCHRKTAALGRRHTLHDAGAPGGRCLDCHMASIVRAPACSRGIIPWRPRGQAGQVPRPVPSVMTTRALRWRPRAGAGFARSATPPGIGHAVEGAETSGVATLVRIAPTRRRAGSSAGRAADHRRLNGAPTDPLAAMLRAGLSDPNPALRRAAAAGSVGSDGPPTSRPSPRRGRIPIPGRLWRPPTHSRHSAHRRRPPSSRRWCRAPI
jgi:predicted CXXCH cytochrome family protein